MAPQDIDGLFLNLNYEKDSLTCTSGTSVKFFTLDKSLDHAWEENLEKFFRQKQIPLC